MLGALWWVLFTAAAVWAQQFLPGVDLLAAGLVLSLQRESKPHSVILGLAFVLLQEGAGSQPFGTALLWYWLLGLFFWLGGWLFQARSMPFMALLGLALGLLHLLLTYATATLAVKGAPFDRVLLEGVGQAVVFPIEWYILDRLYPVRERRRHGRAV